MHVKQSINIILRRYMEACERDMKACEREMEASERELGAAENRELQLTNVGRCWLNRWKPVLKLPGSMPLKLENQDMMDQFQTLVSILTCAATSRKSGTWRFRLGWRLIGGRSTAGAHTRPLFGSTYALSGG